MKESQAGNTRAFYDRDSSTYDSRRFSTGLGKYENDAYIQSVMSLLGPLKGRLVADVGCGTGRFSVAIADEGAEIVGVDFANRMLREFWRKAKRLDMQEEIHLIESGAQQIAVRDNVFDACICVNTLHLAQDYKRVLKEINRILKPGGKIVANFPNLQGIYFPVGLLVNHRKRALSAEIESKWYAIAEIQSAFRESGFEDLNLKGHIIVPVHWPSILLPALRFVDSAFRDSPLRSLAGSVFVKGRKRLNPVGALDGQQIEKDRDS
jgi:SAM-dependent methyltransferase